MTGSMEERFRYNCSGAWYKGNLHTHTSLSDGRKDVIEALSFYAERDYDFVAVTDHRVPFATSEWGDDLPLMVLEGIELDGVDGQNSYYHVVCIGGVQGLTREMDLMEAMAKARSQGSFLIWAHPHWSGNTAEEGLRHGFHGIEVWNHGSEISIGKGIAAFHWDAVLVKQPDLLGFATDDNHFFEEGYPPQVGGWVMVNAPELTPEAMTAAIRQGNFYSSCGPEFKTIRIEQGNRVVAETSPHCPCPPDRFGHPGQMAGRSRGGNHDRHPFPDTRGLGLRPPGNRGHRREKGLEQSVAEKPGIN